MKSTNYARRLDPQGRIVIPSKLREEVGMAIGECYTFYIEERNGHTFLCIDCGAELDEVEAAKQLLTTMGYEVLQRV